jgi:uncharacterized protein (TIGR02996 family)
MPDYWALIRQIRAIDRDGGDSTLARLITADWLEDHGEEDRAEYIRLNITDKNLCGSQKPEAYRSAALDEPRLSADYVAGCLEAGFLSIVRCPLAWWLTHGPDICRRHPVREVVIADAEWHIGIRSGDVWMEYVVTLDQVPGFRPRTRHATHTLAASELGFAALRWAEREADRE